ncbi:hypothetical protein [Krasilnikovia sp. MM14-A1259]|uniref:deoxynucleotide monophosphate kinase family protein n=1 Tax=Krasilnikovia sp. MM14-A1259 TaxID=3373539 RepID=UPI00381C92AB
MASPLIGLVGRKRVGKDTVAQRLVHTHAFTRFAFADLLREAVLRLDPIVLPMDSTWASYRLSEVVAQEGWESAKEIPEVRRLLQNYGTAIREVDPAFWICPVLSALDGCATPAVVTDVRFPNEADALLARGATLLRITRPGLDESDQHESETAMADYPIAEILRNTNDIEHMFDRVDAWVLGRHRTPGRCLS